MTQENVYKYVQQTVRKTLLGTNVTIFAYGQTGTGKTHTILGHGLETQDDVEWGITPRAVRDIFTGLKETQSGVQCSFLQIYNDKLFDLLRDRKRQKQLVLREKSSSVDGETVHVQGLSAITVHNPKEVFVLLRRGLLNRAVRETEMNSQSSRSHAILQLRIKVGCKGEASDSIEKMYSSKLNIVDLAGSEKWNTSIYMKDCHEKELRNINTSLHALGNCIAALTETHRKHIPYRDSTLTRLLQDSLGGNTSTVLIATISGAATAADETLRTLQFADRSKSVMHRVTVNSTTNVNDALLNAKAEIATLHRQLKEFKSTTAASSSSSPDHSSLLGIIERFEKDVKDKQQKIELLEETNAQYEVQIQDRSHKIRQLEEKITTLSSVQKEAMKEKSGSRLKTYLKNWFEIQSSDRPNEIQSPDLTVLGPEPVTPPDGRVSNTDLGPEPITPPVSWSRDDDGARNSENHMRFRLDIPKLPVGQVSQPSNRDETPIDEDDYGSDEFEQSSEIDDKEVVPQSYELDQDTPPAYEYKQKEFATQWNIESNESEFKPITIERQWEGETADTPPEREFKPIKMKESSHNSESEREFKPIPQQREPETEFQRVPLRKPSLSYGLGTNHSWETTEPPRRPNQVPSVKNTARSSSTWSQHDPQSSRLQTNRKPEPQSNSCERHRLAGCVICAIKRNETTWMQTPTARKPVLGRSVEPVEETKPQVNTCDIHRLANCVICRRAKSKTGNGSKECERHRLTNCALCKNSPAENLSPVVLRRPVIQDSRDEDACPSKKPIQRKLRRKKSTNPRVEQALEAASRAMMRR